VTGSIFFSFYKFSGPLSKAGPRETVTPFTPSLRPCSPQSRYDSKLQNRNSGIARGFLNIDSTKNNQTKIPNHIKNPTGKQSHFKKVLQSHQPLEKSFNNLVNTHNLIKLQVSSYQSEIAIHKRNFPRFTEKKSTGEKGINYHPQPPRYELLHHHNIIID
jgi:hypothetical protein